MPISQFQTTTIVSPFITDVLDMPQGHIQANSTGIHLDATPNDLSTATGQNILAAQGDYVAVTADDTWFDICDVTGRGKFHGCISPGSNGTCTHTFRFTIDGGSPVEMDIPSVPNTQHAYIGHIVKSDTYFTTAQMTGGGLMNLRTNDAAWSPPVATYSIINPLEVLRSLKFDTAFKAEVKCSSRETAAYERNAYCLWHLDEV